MKKLFITFCLIIVSSSLSYDLFGQTIYAQTEVQPPTTSPADTVTNAPIFYIPLIMSQVRPATPILNAIANPEGDGVYAVSWSAAQHAEHYLLQVATDANFANPSPVAESADTIYTATAQPMGLYYYRVAAMNSVGSSDWSNVQSVNVRPPTTFPSVGDASVLQGAPDINDDPDGDTWVGYQHCNGAKITRSLMKFDLSAIPAGTAIAQAQLRLYLHASCDLGNRSHTIAVHPVSGAWEEAAVTWNTQPATGDALGSASVQSRSWGWYAMDVTELTRQWINGTLANNGLMLRGPESSGNSSAMLAFLTRNAGASYTPYLEISYTGVTGATTTPPVIDETLVATMAPSKSLLTASGVADPSSAWVEEAELQNAALFSYQQEDELVANRLNQKKQ